MYTVLLRLVAGNLVATIPRRLARQLNWPARTLLVVLVEDDNTARIQRVEDYLAHRRTRTPFTPLTDPRARTPTAREHRPG